MSESKHTAIPWWIVRSRDFSNDVGITAYGLKNVLAEVFAEVHERGDVRPDEAQANAEFIVNCCNNYDALKARNAELLAVLSGILNNHNLHNEVDDSWWQAARVVIDLAKKEPANG